jgi:hypothetical protein
MYFALPYAILIRLHRAALDARRRDRTWRYFAWSLAAGVCGTVLATIALSMSYALYRAGLWPLALILVALFVEPVAHGWLVRHVFAPFGWYRAAFWTAHLATMRDSDAYGLTCAAWAHSLHPTPTGEAWIAARRDKRTPLGDTEIVVTALLAAARGDAETARQLLRSLEQVVEIHPEVRELAGEWLACDAAERGAWTELATDAAAARWPATTLSFLLEGIALRRIGDPRAPGIVDLRARWLLAPHRRATRALLDAPPAVATSSAAATSSVAATSSGPAATAEPDATGADDMEGARPRAVLPRAIAAHLQLSVEPPSAPRLAFAVRSWDLALADDSVRTWLARRALELDAPLGAVDRALREVTGSVTDELARVAERGALAAPQPPHGAVGHAIARRLRHGRLDALEAGFTRWAERRKTGEVRAAIDEWREWVALRAAYDAAIATGGLELRRLAFPHAYSTGTNMAAWLWNARKEYALSHAISAWLLTEALGVGDTEAIELCTRNVGLSVPTRLGNIKTS